MEGYGAFNTLHEMMTVKSDDVKGRADLYHGIATNGSGVKLEDVHTGKPFALNVLFKELWSLGIDVSAYRNGEKYDMDSEETKAKAVVPVKPKQKKMRINERRITEQLYEWQRKHNLDAARRRNQLD